MPRARCNSPGGERDARRPRREMGECSSIRCCLCLLISMVVMFGSAILPRVARAGEGSVTSLNEEDEVGELKPQRWLSLAVEMGATSFSAERPLELRGRSIISARLFSQLHGFVGYRAAPGRRFESGGMTLKLEPHLFELGLLRSWEFGNWELKAGASALVNYITWESDSPSPQLDALTPAPDWAVAAAPQLGLTYRLPGGVFGLALACGADVWLTGRHYDLPFSDDAEAALSPWQVRPWVSVGLTISFF